MNSRLIANAALNVVAGASSAMFSLAVPALLASRVSAVDLSIWSSALQAGIFATPFTLGMQGVLARHVALHDEQRDGLALQSTMTKAFLALGVAACVYFALGLLAAYHLGRIYPGIPVERLPEAQWLLTALLVGHAVSIPSAALAGYFFGLQRNVAITANVLVSKALAGSCIVGLAGTTHMAEAAIAASATMLAANLMLYRAYKRSVRREFNTVPSNRPGSRGPMMLNECGPLSVWTLATFVIYGGTGAVASATDFEAFPAYSVASAAIMLLMGLHSAALGPLIPHMAVIHARGGPEAVADTLERASLMSAAISALMMVAYAAAGPWLISHMLPAAMAQTAMALMPAMLVGNAIRMLGLPYSSAIVGLGMQGRILWTPVLEATTAFVSAWVLAASFGIEGVAWSIALGGVASVATHVFVNMTRTRREIPVRRARSSWQVALVIAPAICILYLPAWQSSHGARSWWPA